MPRPPLTTAMTAMTATIIQRSRRSGPPSEGNRAESNTTLMSRGLTTPRPEVMRISNPTTSTRYQYGRKSRRIRETLPGLDLEAGPVDESIIFTLALVRSNWFTADHEPARTTSLATIRLKRTARLAVDECAPRPDPITRARDGACALKLGPAEVGKGQLAYGGQFWIPASAGTTGGWDLTRLGGGRRWELRRYHGLRRLCLPAGSPP